MDVTHLSICSSFFPTEKQALEAVGFRDYYWESGSELQIYFLNGGLTLKRQIAEIANEWTKYANLDFKFHFGTVPDLTMSDITIQFWRYGGGQSHVGVNSKITSRTGVPSMYLPYTGHRGVVLHEFGHALGLMHEHLNPSAPIKWNRDAVYAYYWEVHKWSRSDVDNNVLARLSADETNFTSFDPTSIMLYEIPADLTTNGFSVKANTELSKTDIDFIRARYPL